MHRPPRLTHQLLVRLALLVATAVVLSRGTRTPPCAPPGQADQVQTADEPTIDPVVAEALLSWGYND